MKTLLSLLTLSLLIVGCDNNDEKNRAAAAPPNTPPAAQPSKALARFEIYAPVELKTDLSQLSENHKKMLVILIDAAQIMDNIFWKQAYGDKNTLLNNIQDPQTRRFAELNYGPWDRLNNNEIFVQGYPAKPAGANLYPADMSKEEFEKSTLPDKTNPYSIIQRDPTGKLTLIPYSKAYAKELTRAATLLKQAAELSEDKTFQKYLQLRATALLTDQYQASDIAWIDMKTNPIELVIGPIENYEDQLFSYRTSFEAFVLIKDPEWSARLARFAKLLPELQTGLPVEKAYKTEKPGTNADLNAYDAIYYAGDSNSGSKTIAINLPNDETVQLKKGTRRLQLKNTMRAKFDKILLPVAQKLIDPSQIRHITFNAFFSNTMFHEIAHGLGIKNTIDGKTTARNALKETFPAIEEDKADILGLYMISALHAKQELKESELMDYYVTFLAGIFRSVRFGASSAHGKANMVSFNFFREHQAFERDPTHGYYRINPDNMQKAVSMLSQLLLTLQGDGNYDAAKQLLEQRGQIEPQLAKDLNQLTEAGIPVDVYFQQGKTILGLTP